MSTPKLRILVIDDEKDIRTLLKLILQTKHEIAEAENGMAGLAMLEQFEPDFVICDIMMPVLTGLETVEAIRKNPKFYDIPVFFLSGERHKDLPELSMEAGGNLFIPKPVDPVRILEFIDEFVDQMGVMPRRREQPASALPPRPAAEAPAGPVRLLTIDPDPNNIAILRQLIENDPKKRWETLFSTDPGACLGNLFRLQPDAILYNPRQQMAGIAFVQNLALRQMLKEYEVCFVGNEASEAETEFNRKNFAREPIRMDQPPEAIVREIAEVIRAAWPKWKKKKHTLAEIQAQDDKLAADVEAHRSDPRRQQFQKMQRKIDRER